jgi:LysR family hydrogen peroxide-inducible transcriptional activator
VKLDNLVAVVTVAETHDIHLAAEEMGLTPSAVRKQIKTVEDVLAISLFEGGKGNLAVTEDGESYVADASVAVERALLAEEKALARQMLRKHHLLIGHSTYLPPKLIALIRQIGIEGIPPMRIEHVSGLTANIVRRVFDGSLHAGFGLLPIDEPELLVRPIHEEPLVACIPTGHKLAAKAVIYPHDLDGEPVVAVGREALPQLHREIEDHFADFGVTLNIVADAFAPPEALHYVVEKVGICLLAATSVTLRQGISLRPLSTRVLKRRSGMFIREDNRSPLIQKLIETILQLASRISSQS